MKRCIASACQYMVGEGIGNGPMVGCGKNLMNGVFVYMVEKVPIWEKSKGFFIEKEYNIGEGEAC